MPLEKMNQPVSSTTTSRPLLHPSLDTTSAETRVREAAACIGWNNEHRLSTVLNCMNEEQVIFAWQLPALDSAQWKALGAPIGLAAAVKQLALLKESSSIAASAASDFAIPTALSATGSPSSRSVDSSLLQVGFSSGVDDDIFEDQEEEEEEVLVDASALCLFPVTVQNKENAIGDAASSAPRNTARKKKIHISGTSKIKRRPGRTSSLPDMGSHRKRKGDVTTNAMPYSSNPGMFCIVVYCGVLWCVVPFDRCISSS
jgi:hypothetical protein